MGRSSHQNALPAIGQTSQLKVAMGVVCTQAEEAQGSAPESHREVGPGGEKRRAEGRFQSVKAKTAAAEHLAG